MIGEVNRGIRIFHNPPRRMACQPAPTATAPMMPPTKAWEELLGKPRNHVSRFHRMALLRAASTIVVVMVVGSTTSFPIVLATATPKIKGPENSASAMVPSATRGEKARDEIIVATILLESCTPFRKSKHRARAITAMSTGVMNRPPPDGLQRILGRRTEELSDGTDRHGLGRRSLFPPDLQADASRLEHEEVEQP